MPTLAETLRTTTPVSSLRRKARRLGLPDLQDIIALAIERGCKHYTISKGYTSRRIPRSLLGDDELTILLLLGENHFEPTAIRCAAQLARSPEIRPEQLVRLAVMEKCERVLSHIARAGATYDSEGSAFWETILRLLPEQPAREEPDLPHWSRFVSMPGIQRHGQVLPTWLTPRS